MKSLVFYMILLAILLQNIFASSFLNEESTSLSAGKNSGSARPRKVVGKPVKKRKSTGVKKLEGRKNKKVRKNSKSKDVAVVKEDKSRFLTNILPKVVIEIIIDYFIDDLYPRIVSTHNWILEDKPNIAVDSARLYAMLWSGSINYLNHSLANIKEDEHHLIELGGLQWSNYSQLSSSHDGRYVSCGHDYRMSTNLGGEFKCSIKWFTQNNDPDDGRLKRIAFDEENSHYEILSQDGQTLCSYYYEDALVRIYRLREEAGKDPMASMEFEFIGGPVLAVSGKGNRIVGECTGWLEIHDIGKDASNLVCKIAVSFNDGCALNEDGSEAAFVIDNELLIVEVDKASDFAMEQSAIVKVNVPESLGPIHRLVYDDGGKLHVLHAGHKVSLFDPSTKKLILLEAPEEGQGIIYSAISPNANYIAFLLSVGREENGKTTYRTIVKRKLRRADLRDILE